jgi:hypothetical protein
MLCRTDNSYLTYDSNDLLCTFYVPSVRTAHKTQLFYCSVNSCPRKRVYSLSVVPYQRLYASHLVSLQFLYCCLTTLPNNGCFCGSTDFALSKYLYCCLTTLPNNGCFCGSTDFALSKYATILILGLNTEYHIFRTHLMLQ